MRHTSMPDSLVFGRVQPDSAEDVPGGLLVLDEVSQQLHHLSGDAHRAWELLEAPMTAGQLVASTGWSRAHADEVLDHLQVAGLAGVTPRSHVRGPVVPRRSALLAGTSAVAVGIVSVGAPAPAEAASKAEVVVPAREALQGELFFYAIAAMPYDINGTDPGYDNGGLIEFYLESFTLPDQSSPTGQGVLDPSKPTFRRAYVTRNGARVPLVPADEGHTDTVGSTTMAISYVRDAGGAVIEKIVTTTNPVLGTTYSATGEGTGLVDQSHRMSLFFDDYVPTPAGAVWTDYVVHYEWEYTDKAGFVRTAAYEHAAANAAGSLGREHLLTIQPVTI